MNDSLDPILQQEEQRKLRTQLMWRLAFAVLLVGGVLGALAWLDQDKEPQMTVTTPHDARIASSIASEAASAVASEPETASAAEASTPQASAAASEILPASFVAGEPSALPASQPQATPATPQPAASQPLPAQLKTGPQTISAKPAAPAGKPGIPTIVPPAAPAKPVEPTRPHAPLKAAETPAKPLPSPLPAPDKLAQQPAAVAHYPAPIATSSGYTVQAGVFLHAANAERMLRSVQGAGIPAYLETRVQIGPFGSKAEAEAAVKKLRQIGIEPIVKGN